MISGPLFTALASASCGIYAVSLDQTIVFWNRAAERILGYTAQEILGRRCYEVIKGMAPGSLTPECLGGCPSIRYLRAGLVPSKTRLRMFRSSGESKWVTVNPMVVSGIVEGTPLLMHIFDDSEDEEDFGQFETTVRGVLSESGAEVLSDRAPGPVNLGGDPGLTPRELEVLRLVALGWETPRIAEQLGISRHTVRNHIRNLRQKLSASTKLEAVIAGIRLGILPVN